MAISKILSDLLEQDKFAKFTKTGNTTATLGSLTLDTAINGPAGIDTGSVAASTFYYVYTIVHSNSIKLIASISSTSPTGFTQYKKVGAFYTDSSSNIFKAYYFGEVNQTVFSAKISTTGIVSDENVNWINGNCTISITSSYTCTFNTSIFSAAPSCTMTALGGGAVAVRHLTATTSTTVNPYTFNPTSGAALAADFQIICQKQGIDAVQPDWSRV